MADTPKITDNPSRFVSALHSITIRKIVADKVVGSFPVVSSATSGLGESRLLHLNINEGMFAPFMHGFIEVIDKNDWVTQLNPTGGDDIIIKFGFLDNPESPIELKFKIVSLKITNNFSDISENKTGSSEKVITYKIEFVSPQIYSNVFTKSFLELDKDFIGYIAKGIEQQPNEQDEVPGLVEHLSTKLNLQPIEIEGTKNGIWFKHNDISYPASLPQGQIDFSTLMKHISNFSVSRENPNAANFYFWNDRDGWYFKSIEKILKENESKTNFVTYDLNNDSYLTDNIKKYIVISVRVENQNDKLSLLTSKNLMSYYKRIEPDYKNPYSDFLSSEAGYTYTIVDYDYHRDFSKIRHIEKHKLVDDSFPTTPYFSKDNENEILKPSANVRDSVFGYYNLIGLNTPFQTGTHYSQDRGFGAKVENPKVVWWDYLDKKEDSKWSNVTWQPQFDTTELEIKKLYDIQTKIRAPIEEKRKEYVKLKNLKREWEVYRCVVCCYNSEDYGIKDKQDILEFENFASGISGPGGPAATLFELITDAISFSPLSVVSGLASPGISFIKTIGSVLSNLFFGDKTKDEYNFLFGENGVFSKEKQEYKVVSAGSFTDVLDYDKKNEDIQHGLTLSVNLDNLTYLVPAGVNAGDYTPNQWYSSTIGQFFNIKENISNYSKYVLDRGINQYDIEIQKLQQRKGYAEQFIQNVSSYITKADEWIESRLLPCCESVSTPSGNVQFRTTVQGSSTTILGSLILGGSADGPGGGGGESADDGFYGSCCCSTCGGGSYGCENSFSAVGQSFCSSRGGDWIGYDAQGDGARCASRDCTTFNCTEGFGEPNPNGSCCYFNSDGTSVCSDTTCENCYNLSGNFTAYATCSPSSCGSPSEWGACCVDCEIFNSEAGDDFPITCRCIDGLSSEQCTQKAIDLGDIDRSKFYPFLTCQEINNCRVTPPANYNLCEEDGPACLRQGCTDPLTGSVFSREPSACVGYNYVDGLGNVPLIVLPEGMCMKCNNFLQEDSDSTFDQINCCNCSEEEAKTFTELPEWAKECSKEKFMNAIAQYIGTESNWYFYYQFAPGSVEAFQNIDAFVGPNGDPAVTRECLDNGDCYNKLCFNPLYLEVEKRRAEQEIKIIDAEIALLEYTKQIIETNFVQSFTDGYQEWWNRKAFFYSVTPGKNVFTDVSTGISGSIAGGRTGPISSQTSLFNVKSIKKKHIRGSRYEILAKSKGITGAEIGPWLYNFVWAGGTPQEQGTNHPYYSQKYNCSTLPCDSFITQRQLFKNYAYANPNKLNDFPFISKYAPVGCADAAWTVEIENISLPELSVPSYSLGTVTDLGYSQYDLNTLGANALDYSNTFNLFDVSAATIPANLKKEQLSTYVRIEFERPIGLDRIVDFPNGFVRDAGTEYFLPYLVSLTPGPTGRQTIRNNVAVIGMDPYGFDVAVKKSEVSDEETRKQYHWWNEYRNLNDTSLTNNGMELWPEVGFETQYPYYTSDPKGWWWNSSWYHGENVGDILEKNGNSYDWFSRSADVDPEYKESAHGSGYLQHSYRKTKPHRSWWSFHIPKNIFIPQKLFHMLATKYAKIGGESSGILGDLFALRYTDYYWWYGDEVDRWLTLSDEGSDFIRNVARIISPSESQGGSNTAKVYEQSPVQSGLQEWFRKTTMNWLTGKFLLYRPGLVESDVWKYDLTGESNYGLVSPKTLSPNHDVFDDNFSAQFLVFSRENKNVCEGFVCANPSGPISSDGCAEDDPYCNCPAQRLMPDEPEPSYLDLYRKYKELKECELIEKHLGSDYLGCVWSDPNAPCSCICPEQGDKFNEYLAYNRTYATFWDTPNNTILNRISQIGQLSAQQLQLVVPAVSTVKVGDIIMVKHYSAVSMMLTRQEKPLHGKWMVTNITHSFTRDNNQTMILQLARDTFSSKDSKCTINPLKNLLSSKTYTGL